MYNFSDRKVGLQNFELDFVGLHLKIPLSNSVFMTITDKREVWQGWKRPILSVLQNWWISQMNIQCILVELIKKVEVISLKKLVK